MTAPANFAILIVSHGRPDRVYTDRTLQRIGFSGPVYIVVDNEDPTLDQYRATFGERVLVFDKATYIAAVDDGDNFGERRGVVYARNACFDLARQLGVTYFMVLDDDYLGFTYRMDASFGYEHERAVKGFDGVVTALLAYYQAIPAASLAIAQGGDFIGGKDNDFDRSINQRRKCMNSFICSTERPFPFMGRINEDVIAYTWYQSLGHLFLTFPLVSLHQLPTQTNQGGMTDLYLDHGTYVKSFYSVMWMPSSVSVRMMGIHNPRLHHGVDWDATVPCILAETYRKRSRPALATLEG